MQQRPDTSERRRHTRHEISHEMSVELRVAMSGDEPAMLLRRGLVSDISCGGLRCDIDLDVPVGTRVDIRFPGSAEDALAPRTLDGRVVRTITAGGVAEQVAIAFAHPLDQLDPELLSSAAQEPSLRGRTAAARRASWADEPQIFPTFATGSLL